MNPLTPGCPFLNHPSPLLACPSALCPSPTHPCMRPPTHPPIPACMRPPTHPPLLACALPLTPACLLPGCRPPGSWASPRSPCSRTHCWCRSRCWGGGSVELKQAVSLLMEAVSCADGQLEGEGLTSRSPCYCHGHSPCYCHGHSPCYCHGHSPCYCHRLSLCCLLLLPHAGGGGVAGLSG